MKEKYRPSSFLKFNTDIPRTMHIDLNSCFARIEQQENPFLREKPVAVCAYTTGSGCILAPSVEAKKLGVKVGMRVRDGKKLCPSLIVLSPDPQKYRYVHLKLKRVLSRYTSEIVPKSIDEFVLNFGNSPYFKVGLGIIACEIKKSIKEEIGEYLTVSIGISTNRFLAKTASSLNKPDGLDEINKENFLEIYEKLALCDLCGIKERNALRLNSAGIFSVLDFYNASMSTLKSAFGSICGYYWYLRLRGIEIDDVEPVRQSFGNSFALPKFFSLTEELTPLIYKLVTKASSRMRRAGFCGGGIHLALLFSNYSFWHKGQILLEPLFDTRDIYKEILALFLKCPYKGQPIRQIAVTLFNLKKLNTLQLEFSFGDRDKKQKLMRAVDTINSRWGSFVITPAKMMEAKEAVNDRIAFGSVKEIESFIGLN